MSLNDVSSLIYKYMSLNDVSSLIYKYLSNSLDRTA